MFFASEVSVICELNPYRKVHDTFLEVWKRTNPSQIACVEHKIKCELTSHDEKIEKLIKKIDVDGKISTLVKSASTAKTIEEVKQSVERIEAIIPKLPVDTGSKVAEMISKIDSLDIQKDILKSVKSQMNRGFGTKQETAAISTYEKKEKTNVGSRNDKFHKRTIDIINGCAIVVGGKVDGIKEDGTVIEVKNRMRRFFDPLPKYDVAQLQTYLFILNASNGELVEQLKGSKTDIKSTPIERDLEMWNTIIKPSVVRFGAALCHFMNDDDLQHKFVLGNELERERLLKELL